MYTKLIHLIALIVVIGLFGASDVQGTDPSLVAWYRFDGDASDSSGNNLHGTEMGDPTYTTGVFGQAIDLDGDGDYVDCGAPPEFDITDEITFMYWIQVRQFDLEWNTVLSRGDDSWRSSRASTNNFMEAAVGGTSGNYLYGVTPVDDGQWHHIAATYDGTTFYLYTDGQLDASEPSTGQITASSYPLYIGDNSQATGRFWNGLIDDVMIFNRAFSQEEIQEVMTTGAGDYPIASSPNPADGAIHVDTWVSLTWNAGDFAVSHDVYLGENIEVVSNATPDSDVFRGNQGETFYVAGFPGFAYPEGLVPGTTYYWRIDEVNDADPNSPWKGDVWSFSIPPKTAYNPDPGDGDGMTETTVTLSWTPGFGAKLHTVFFGDDYDTVANATLGVPAGITSYNPGPLEAEKVYYWRVDEFDGLSTYKGDVWSFTTPGAVGNPNPAYDATEAAMNATLSWTPANSAASHQLYFGTDEAAVRNAGSGSPEYKGSKALGEENYDPGLLDADTTYYWRVDEVDAQGNTSKGPLWVFTTGAFLFVDDFESYTDDDAAGEAIWQTWIDGYGVADNGAQVGYLVPPYAEQTIVHSGAQSMPLMYVNDAGVTNSEATMTLVSLSDWTQAGVTELSLWFVGSSSNATDPMYVAIANSSGFPAVVAHDDSGATQMNNWTQWIIPLQAFADQGINLGNVDTIMIGLGSKGGAVAGGSGTMYIDDIRLYRP
ncbi:MAG: LamG domain-containing protein [Sedimentisphaerales bacterium]|nr:LamG domain-containing protein [Sedimentisphaerales bacterium]